MNLIWGRRRLCRDYISKSSLRSLAPPESSYDKALVDLPAVSSSEPSVANYIEKNLQKILKTVLEA